MDDLGRALLKLELEKPGISSPEMIRDLSLTVDRKTVDSRRRLPEYQDALLSARNNALAELRDAQIIAIRKLKELAQDSDPTIALPAAKILAEATLRAASKAAELEMESCHSQPPVKQTIEVILPDNLPIIGESYIDDTGAVRRLPSQSKI